MSTNKVVTIEEAIAPIKDGMSIMIGGFLSWGVPDKIVDALIEKGVKDITLIGNDSGFVDSGVGKLIVNKRVSKVITSHIGTNAETGRQMTAEEIEVELVPQGTLAERIRAAGAGLGGVLTPTGIGTKVEEGKQKLKINGKMYLLEEPLRADVAILSGYIVDKSGNIMYGGATENFNSVMAPAADYVIVQADNIVEIGELDPRHATTPGIFIDCIVDGGAR